MNRPQKNYYDLVSYTRGQITFSMSLPKSSSVKERANEINPTSKCTQETQIYSSIFEHIDFVKIIDYTNFFLMDPLRTFQTGG